MGASMEVGVPRWWRALMELMCENIFREGGEFSRNLLHLEQEMVPTLGFGMIIGAGISP
jgi:hypothetical protein